MLACERSECGIELVPPQTKALALDLHPHEERAVPCMAHMLVRAQDVPIVQGDETGYRSDQSPVIRAVDQETDVIAHARSRNSALPEKAKGTLLNGINIRSQVPRR